ncbi:FGFP2 protein, partial [Polyodon spathula]|nr:fibroblast growth factor-binding protein 2-like [Polyodon spathula]XP_041117393.1 fibroblast growth factor-binding protein 2-like [Polyodon spathula]MBN3284173.1 FGFP2 protein [Polyodon spathula]
MRLLCILVLILCLYGPQEAEGKKENGNKQQDKKGKIKSIPSSGELITKDNHRCTWETSGEGEVSLLLNCIEEDKTYWCRFTGQPELCSNYNSKSSLYWKQVVGKVKKKKNACDGDRVLKTRICKKGPAESHMKLSEKSGPAGEAPEKGKGKGSRKKDSGPESSDKKKEKKPQELEKDDFGEVNDGNSESEVEPVENYCADNWHSVCSFFVKFFDG